MRAGVAGSSRECKETSTSIRKRRKSRRAARFCLQIANEIDRRCAGSLKVRCAACATCRRRHTCAAQFIRWTITLANCAARVTLDRARGWGEHHVAVCLLRGQIETHLLSDLYPAILQIGLQDNVRPETQNGARRPAVELPWRYSRLAASWRQIKADGGCFPRAE